MVSDYKNLHGVRYESHIKQMLNLFWLGTRRVNTALRRNKKTFDNREETLSVVNTFLPSFIF